MENTRASVFAVVLVVDDACCCCCWSSVDADEDDDEAAVDGMPDVVAVEPDIELNTKF